MNIRDAIINLVMCLMINLWTETILKPSHVINFMKLPINIVCEEVSQYSFQFDTMSSTWYYIRKCEPGQYIMSAIEKLLLLMHRYFPFETWVCKNVSKIFVCYDMREFHEKTRKKAALKMFKTFIQKILR